MDSNITINSIPFRKSYDSQDLGVRRGTTRGINNPDIMTIKRQDTNEGPSKEATQRFSVRFDRHTFDEATGKTSVPFVQNIIGVPISAASSDIEALIATNRAFWASVTPDYIAQVTNGEV